MGGTPSKSLLGRGEVEQSAVLATRLRLCADMPLTCCITGNDS